MGRQGRRDQTMTSKVYNLALQLQNSHLAVAQHACETSETGEIKDGHSTYLEVDDPFHVVCAQCGIVLYEHEHEDWKQSYNEDAALPIY
jgi:hypothetical protein